MTARLLPWFLLATVAVASAASAGCHLLLTDIEVSEDGTPLRCRADTCNGRGTCDHSSGVAVCTCDAPYGGQYCDGCMAGLRAEDNMCTCCAIVQNPDFDDASHWDVTGAARIEGGAGKLPPDAACTGGSLRQTVSIPPEAYTGRLMVVLTVRATNSTPVRLGVGLNGEWTDLGPVATGDFQQRVACLSSGLAGAEVDFELAPYFTEACGPFVAGTVEIDRADIVQANEVDCPGDEFVPNGDFEDGDVSWSGNWAVGAEGGRDGGLVARHDGAAGHLEGTVHIPPRDDVGSPALQLWHQAPDKVVLSVMIGGQHLGAWAAQGDWTEGRLCLPPWLLGTSATLRFEVGYVAEFENRGGFTALLDDVTVVSDARCNWSDGFIGGSFEPLGAPTLSRSMVARAGWGSYNAAPPPVRETPDYGYLAELEVGRCVDHCPDNGCLDPLQYVTMNGVGAVPAASATGGPAIAYSYRKPGAGAGTNVNGPNFWAQLEPSDEWQHQVHCLPPGYAGRNAWFYFEHYLQEWYYCWDGPEDAPIYPVQIKDLELVNHPSCN
jgi:hypothetical protein